MKYLSSDVYPARRRSQENSSRKSSRGTGGLIKRPSPLHRRRGPRCCSETSHTALLCCIWYVDFSNKGGRYMYTLHYTHECAIAWRDYNSLLNWNNLKCSEISITEIIMRKPIYYLLSSAGVNTCTKFPCSLKKSLGFVPAALLSVEQVTALLTSRMTKNRRRRFMRK